MFHIIAADQTATDLSAAFSRVVLIVDLNKAARWSLFKSVNMLDS